MSQSTVVIVSDSPLGGFVKKRLEGLNYAVLTDVQWRANKKPIAAVLFCLEASFKEPRKALTSKEDFEDQWARLMEGETKRAFSFVFESLSYLLAHSKTAQVPSSIVFLGSKLVRSPNSPQQIMASSVKRAVAGFAGSLFF